MHNFFVYFYAYTEWPARKQPCFTINGSNNLFSNKITTNIGLLHSRSYFDVIKES